MKSLEEYIYKKERDRDKDRETETENSQFRTLLHKD